MGRLKYLIVTQYRMKLGKNQASLERCKTIPKGGVKNLCIKNNKVTMILQSAKLCTVFVVWKILEKQF